MTRLALALSLDVPGSVRGGGAPVAAIVISANTTPEDSTAGTTVGTLSTVLTTGTAVFSLVDNAGSRFALSGAIIQRGATALDYETTTYHNIVVGVTGVTPSIANTTLTINVTDVVESAWTPASLGSALRVWLKADVGITLNTTLVAAWADQSGQTIDFTQPGGGFQPTYAATGFNSLPTVSFIAASYSSLISTADDVFNIGTASSWFVVGQMHTETASYGRLFSYEKTGAVVGGGDYDRTDRMAALIRDASNNGISGYYNSAAASAQAMTLATNHRFGVIWDGANFTPYVDNVAGTPMAKTPNMGGAGGTLKIGDTIIGAASPFDGLISEIVITNTALSSGDRLSLDNYFKTKWGLS